MVRQAFIVTISESPCAPRTGSNAGARGLKPRGDRMTEIGKETVRGVDVGDVAPEKGYAITAVPERIRFFTKLCARPLPRQVSVRA